MKRAGADVHDPQADLPAIERRAAHAGGHWDVLTVEQYTDGAEPPEPPEPGDGDYYVDLVATFGGIEIPIRGTISLIPEQQ